MKKSTLALAIAITTTLSAFAEDTVCDTRDHKNVKVVNSKLFLTEDGQEIAVKVKSSKFVPGSKLFKTLLTAVGTDGSATTLSPLNVDEAARVARIDAKIGAAANLLIFSDNQKVEIARFLGTQGDFARCVLR